MIKNNVYIKDSISYIDTIAMTNELVDGYFLYNDESAKYIYVPYFRNTNFLVAFFRYAVDGLEFEDGENIYNAVQSDEELVDMFNNWYQNVYPHNSSELAQQITAIMKDVDDILDFRKKQIIASSANPEVNKLLVFLLKKESERQDVEIQTLKTLDKFYESQNKLNELMSPEEQVELTRKMAEKEFDPAKISELLADKYFGSGEHAAKLSELFDTKQEIIEVLKNEILEKDKLILNMNKQFGNPLNLDVTLVD